jgi:hypothetical protein
MYFTSYSISSCYQHQLPLPVSAAQFAAACPQLQAMVEQEQKAGSAAAQ